MHPALDVDRCGGGGVNGPDCLTLYMPVKPNL